MKYTV
jgi:two-component sensor histidine kinase